MDYVAFSIILDDIVYSDGKTYMGILGGGGPQTAFGMRLWADSVGISAGVGTDLPASALEWMRISGIEEGGLRFSEQFPTPRAWQLIEKDGHRTQVWRIPAEAIGTHMSQTLNNLPEICKNAKGYHIGIHPTEINFEFLSFLAQQGGTLSVEPFKPADHPIASDTLERLFDIVDIFSPNLMEAASLVGEEKPLEILRSLLHFDAKITALRLGSEGSIIADGRSGKCVMIPAVPVNVIDPVGAGNAYCGGFLVGWTETRDLATAGMYGAVAASFLVEQVGLPLLTPSVKEEAFRRLAFLRGKVDTFSLS